MLNATSISCRGASKRSSVRASLLRRKRVTSFAVTLHGFSSWTARFASGRFTPGSIKQGTFRTLERGGRPYLNRPNQDVNGFHQSATLPAETVTESQSV